MTSALTIIHVKSSCHDRWKFTLVIPVSRKTGLWTVFERKRLKFFKCAVGKNGDRDSSVGIATRYGLNGGGFEPWWGQEIYSFPRPCILAVGPTQPRVQWVSGLFPGSKAARARRLTTTPTSHRDSDWVELYLFSPSVPAWHVTGRTLPYTLITFSLRDACT